VTTQLDPFDAQDLALQIHMRWDFDDVAPGVLDELADAVLAWTEEPELEEIVTRAVAHCWSPALEQDLRDSLSGLADASPGCRHRARLALADLELSHGLSELARAFVLQCAVQYAHDGLLICLCCIEEGLVHLEPARGRSAALDVARVAARDVDLPEAEVKSALRESALNPRRLPERLATDARREAMRRRIGRIAALSARSLPLVSRELRRALEQSRQAAPADDELWATLCRAVAGDVTLPEFKVV